MKKVGVFGAGRLGSIVARAINSGIVEGVELYGVFSRTLEKVKTLSDELGCVGTNSFEEFMSGRPDYIIEATNSEAVKEYTQLFLEAGSDIIILTTGPFGNSEFYDKIKDVAVANERKVHLASGVVGGFDIMTTAKLMGDFEAKFTCKRISREGSLSEFNGSCAELYEKTPNHLNVAVSVGLGSGGMEDTLAVLEPLKTGERTSFSTTLEGHFGKSYIHTELGNRGPEMAAFSAVAVLHRLVSPISF